MVVRWGHCGGQTITYRFFFTVKIVLKTLAILVRLLWIVDRFTWDPLGLASSVLMALHDIFWCWRDGSMICLLSAALGFNCLTTGSMVRINCVLIYLFQVFICLWVFRNPGRWTVSLQKMNPIGEHGWWTLLKAWEAKSEHISTLIKQDIDRLSRKLIFVFLQISCLTL